MWFSYSKCLPLLSLWLFTTPITRVVYIIRDTWKTRVVNIKAKVYLNPRFLHFISTYFTTTGWRKPISERLSAIISRASKRGQASFSSLYIKQNKTEIMHANLILHIFFCILVGWERGVLFYPTTTAVSNPRLCSTYCIVHCIVYAVYMWYIWSSIASFQINFSLPNDPRLLRKVLMVAGNTVYNSAPSFILVLMIASPFTLSNFQTLYGFHMFSL